MLLLVGETNSREAGDFFHAYLSPDVFFSPVGWLLLLVLLHVLFVCRRWLYRFIPENYRLLARRAIEKLMLFGHRFCLNLITGAVVLGLLIAGIVTSFHNKVQMTRLMTADTIGTVEHILTEPDHAEFYLPIYRLAFSVYSSLAALRLQLSHNPPSAEARTERIADQVRRCGVVLEPDKLCL